MEKIIPSIKPMFIKPPKYLNVFLDIYSLTGEFMYGSKGDLRLIEGGKSKTSSERYGGGSEDSVFLEGYSLSSENGMKLFFRKGDSTYTFPIDSSPKIAALKILLDKYLSADKTPEYKKSILNEMYKRASTG